MTTPLIPLMKNTLSKYAGMLILTLLNVIITGSNMAGKSYVDDRVRERMKDYVTAKEYEEYRAAHKQLDDVNMHNIRLGLADVKDVAQKALSSSQENTILLMELKADLRARRASVNAVNVIDTVQIPLPP